MNIDRRLCLVILACLLAFTSLPVAAMTEQQTKLIDQLDQLDQLEFAAQIDKARICINVRDFDCADKKITKAAKYASNSKDKRTLRTTRQDLATERQLVAEEERRAEERRQAEEEERQYQIRTNEEERQSQIRRKEEERQAQRRRDEEREARLWREKQAAQETEDRRSLNEYKAALWGNLQNNINRSWAQTEARSRGSSIEEDRAKSRRLSEFNEIISNMEADPNSDLNRDKREREKDRDASQRANSERAAKRDAAKKVAHANDAKRASDERAQAIAETTTREKQKADELKAAQEREKQRADTERRNQELRDTAERKRVAASEEAKRKAEKEREAQAEQQARAQYLQSVTAGTRLVATKCPDGEGKYYATGTRPNIKPEVVSCVDVRFRAYCPGSRQYSEGLAHNFIGMNGCFGDTYEINPKPGCKVDQVRIEVVEARECDK